MAVVRVVVAGVLAMASTAGGTPASEPTRGPPWAPGGAAWTAMFDGDWGRLALRVSGTSVYGVYEHEVGVIEGVIEGDTLVAWWCEVPTRAPDADAGEARMRLARGPGGTFTIDGRWRYGATGVWHEDWDLTWRSATPDTDLAQRLDRETVTCQSASWRDRRDEAVASGAVTRGAAAAASGR